MPRIVIDPVARVAGHLRVEVDIRDGAVRDAWSAATEYRGLERILEGRDPRDAWLFASRVCGSCVGVHALASVRAVEDALDVSIPRNARILRNLLTGMHAVRDHVLGFYQRSAVDWVDVGSALLADPTATSALARSTGNWRRASAAHFREVRDRIDASVRSGRSGPLWNGLTGHPAYRLSPEANLLVAAHALEALDWQRTVARMHTLLGGKNPHPQTWLVGGMALTPPWGGPVRDLRGGHPRQVERNNPAPLGDRGLGVVAELLLEARRFVEHVLVPDLVLVARHYPEWTELGRGAGDYLSFGEYPEADGVDARRFLPAGRVSVRNLVHVTGVEDGGVAESVAHAWYRDDDPVAAFRHPSDGRTEPGYTGPTPPYETLQGEARYSWLKAARYDGRPMEVGALARVLVAYADGRADVRTATEEALTAIGIGAPALSTTVGRLVARGIEAGVLVRQLDRWLEDLIENLESGDLAVADVTAWDPAAWPGDAEGRSAGEGPRGALGHWVRIRDRRVAAYQIVDATGWNASPRDAREQRGPVEEALVGTPVSDPRRPLEVLRTIHSFDPCIACGVH